MRELHPAATKSIVPVWRRLLPHQRGFRENFSLSIHARHRRHALHVHLGKQYKGTKLAVSRLCRCLSSIFLEGYGAMYAQQGSEWSKRLDLVLTSSSPGSGQ